MANNSSPESLNLRLGPLRPKVEALTTQANAQTMSHFVRALIKHISEITDGQPFDVRDLMLKGKDME